MSTISQSVPLIADSRRIFLLSTAGVALSILYLLASNDPSGYGVLGLLGFIQLIPLLFGLLFRDINYLSLILINHLLVYTVGKYNITKVMNRYDSLPSETLDAIWEHVPITFTIIFSYYLTRAFFYRNRSHDGDPPKLLELTPRLSILVWGLIVTRPWIEPWIPVQFFAIYTQLLIGAIALISCSQISNRPLLGRFLKTTIFLFAFAHFLTSGFLGPLVALLSVFIMVNCVHRKFVNLLLIVPAIVPMFLIQPVKGEFRQVVWNNPNIGFLDRFQTLTELIAAKYFEPDLVQNEEEISDEKSFVSEAYSRFGDDSLDRVMALTPSRVPYWEGKSYAALFYAFIPRIVWPGKPKRNWENEFGRKYEVIAPDDFGTSIACGFLAEGYMNFGYTGLYGIAIVFGLLVAAIEFFSVFLLKERLLLTFLIFLHPLTSYATDLTAMLTTLVIMMGVFMAFIALFGTKWLKMAATKA